MTFNNRDEHKDQFHRGSFLPIGKLVSMVLHGTPLSKGLNERRLLDAFGQVTGNGLQKYIADKYIHNRVLYIHVTSSVLRQELTMSRQKLIQTLNDKVGVNVISDIRFC